MILAPGEHRYRETLYQQPRVPGTGLTNLADLIPEMRRIVEPGLYIPEEGIGIRIEDDILVTMDGPVLLSKDIPRTVADIERAMAE